MTDRKPGNPGVTRENLGENPGVTPQDPGVAPEKPGVTRLSFLKASAGVAAGTAAMAVPGAAALAHENAVETDPSSPNPREPVMAYVRDADKGEVTVMAGTHEKTYRDKTLVKRMLKHAPNRGGGI